MRPFYGQFEPSPVLRDYVESIWIQESDAAPDAAPTTVLSTGRVELVFQFADPFKQLTGHRREPLPRCNIVGQNVGPITVQATGKTGFVIVRFKPWAAASLFDMALPEFENQIIDLELIWPRSTDTLINRIHLSNSHSERVLHVENFIGGEVRNSHLDHLVADAIVKMNDKWGRCRVTDIANHYEVSKRQFNRRFIRNVGSSPKRLLRVIRAQKAVACLMYGMDSQDVVCLCGYTDQSHLIRDVVALCGKRPTELRQTLDSRLRTCFNAKRINDYCGLVYL